MVEAMKTALGRATRIYTTAEWRVVLALFVSYLGMHWLATFFLPDAARFNPASAIALSVLYFAGVRLWPAVYVAALVANLFSGETTLGLIFLPLFEVLQASAGSWLLQRAHIDPLFRRYRDTFYFLATILVISLISPTLSTLIRIYHNLPDITLVWWHAYIATLFCFLIVTPFLLRWFTKPRFSRTPPEIIETCAVFFILIGIDYTIFIRGTATLSGIPLIYIMLIPLFWIALKLRPRFMTLALLVTSLFAVAGVLLHQEPGLLLDELYQMEILIIVLATIFFIVTSLEEDRRVNTNIMHSQMAALRNAVAKESSESKAKNDFIAILSHELRNPLAPVLSSIDLLKLKRPHDEEELEIFKIMEDRMETVRRLLDDLLDISRISEGKIALRKDTVELDAVMKRAALSTEHHRKELHQRLVLKLPQKPLQVQGDAVRLEQVFSNLLTNASKFSSSGDMITLSVREYDGLAEIEVIDRGIGIHPGELEMIFLPFRQIEEGERSKKGLGIGLTLVRNFVEMHGGSIEARSEGRGRGSRFIVRLPLLLPETMYDTRNKKIDGVEPARQKKTNPLVLIIDDNDAAAGGIGRLLEFQGYKVAYAYDGNQGLAKARSLMPDAIFLDIGLPDQDGWRVAKNLRTQGFKGRLIALSGYTLDDARKHDSEVRFDLYLVKPIGLAELQRALIGVV